MLSPSTALPDPEFLPSGAVLGARRGAASREVASNESTWIGGIRTAADVPGTAGRRRDPSATSAITASLRSRIRQLEDAHLEAQRFPVAEPLRELLPQGLLAGTSYTVLGSTTLALTMIAEASAGGAWCGVLGVPDLGTEAAAGLGVDLQRLVLVPSAGEQWSAVAGAMLDVLSVVIAQPPAAISGGDVARLGARSRQRKATMILLGPWPQAESTLRVTGSRWAGLGSGHGCLTGRSLLVDVVERRSGGRRRSVEVDLGGPARSGLSLVPDTGTGYRSDPVRSLDLPSPRPLFPSALPADRQIAEPPPERRTSRAG